MVTITFRSGKCSDIESADCKKCPEYKLAFACYNYDVAGVKRILAMHPEVDVNSTVIHSPTKGNGTPWVLTGSKSIAQLLISHGVDVNHPYAVSSNLNVTPLDSAEKYLGTYSVRNDKKKNQEVLELIEYLKTQGGKKYQ